MSLVKAPIRILGLETSCDETAASVVEDGRLILSNVISSQIDLHTKYGGVFPEVASRQHVRTIHAVADQALQQAHCSLENIDAIAVTQGPGLPGSLVVGVNYAKGLALATELPLIGINHLESHIYSAWLSQNVDDVSDNLPTFPLLTLLVSGGHTELILMTGHLSYKRLGGTLDDAAGEAFDKVARLIQLPYPGGPSIQKEASEGNPQAYSFPRARLEGTWDFSFSGLKTAVLRVVRQIEQEGGALPKQNLAASFQAAVVDALVNKTFHAARVHQVKEILVAGGVSANGALRDALTHQKDFLVHIPPIALCTDNAAMVASAGYYRYVNGQRDTLDFDVKPNWRLS